MVTIMLADDHELVRAGLRRLLEEEADFEVIGEARDGQGALRLVEARPPDVAVLDLMMPGMNGLDAARLIRNGWPEVKLVMLTMHSDESYVLQALKIGVTGFVLKEASRTELVEAIRAVHAGRRFLSGQLSERAIDAYVEKARQTGAAPHNLLSAREYEVLQLLAEGHTYQEVAARLSISPRTVETHRASVLSKLGLRTQAELIRYALLNGILK